jgi:quinol-cytochrome oxidoreductase complex cytochrome b subunit
MRKVFFFGIGVLAIFHFVSWHLPAMQAVSGAASFPWLGLMVVDVAVVCLCAWKLFSKDILAKVEHEDIDLEDLQFADTTAYKIIGALLVAAVLWHGYWAIMAEGSMSSFNAIVMIVEIIFGGATFLFFKHAQRQEGKAGVRSEMPSQTKQPRTYT